VRVPLRSTGSDNTPEAPASGRRLFAVMLCAILILPVVAASSAYADAQSGYVVGYATGQYWPGWYAINCQNAYVSNTGWNDAYSYSYVSAGQGNSCTGSNANMQGGWIGVYAEGYLYGSFCGATGWYYNSSATYYFGVGARECGNQRGVGYTIAYAEWWDYLYGSWMYGPVVSVRSPSQNIN